METAKLFWSGRSQAVRLPRAFRVDGREVRIRRRGRAIVLEPVPDSWTWLDALAGKLAGTVPAQPGHCLDLRSSAGNRAHLRGPQASGALDRPALGSAASRSLRFRTAPVFYQ